MKEIASRADVRHAPWMSAAATIAFLMVWELAFRAGLLSPLVAPAPTTILGAILTQTVSGELLLHLRSTVIRVVVGIAIGGSAGLALGLAMGLSSRLRALIDPFVAAVHPLPKIAILPLLMVALGTGEAARIATVALASFFPMLINTMTGVVQISPTHFEVARSYGAGRLSMFTRIVLPASFPTILGGLRIALNLALVITISVEIVASSQGLGAMIWRAWEILRIDQLYAALVVTAMLGLLFNLIIRGLRRALVPWATATEG